MIEHLLANVSFDLFLSFKVYSSLTQHAFRQDIRVEMDKVGKILCFPHSLWHTQYYVCLSPRSRSIVVMALAAIMGWPGGHHGVAGRPSWGGRAAIIGWPGGHHRVAGRPSCKKSHHLLCPDFHSGCHR